MPLIVLALLLPSLAAWLYFVTAAGSGWAPWLYTASKVAMAALPVIAWRWLPTRPLPGGDRGMAIASGLGCGVVMAAVIAMAAFGPLDGLVTSARPAILAKIAEFGIATPGAYLAAALALALVHSAFEEWYWRWFVWRRLRDRCPEAVAHVVAGIGFALHHAVIAAVFVGLWPGIALAAVVAVAGMAWSVLYRRSGSLLAPWLAHVAADLALMAIGWWLLSDGQA